MRVLVVEDDMHLLDAIAGVLEDERYTVDRSENGSIGCMLAERDIYDLLVFDIMLPGMDGLSMISALRKKGIRTPCLFLTARDSIESRVKGLDAGADDYLVKPFAVDELLARVRALLRRMKSGVQDNTLSCGTLVLSEHADEVILEDGTTIKLTSKEHELLSYLIQHKEQIVKRDQIFLRVWGLDSDANDTAVDLYVHYLRKKLNAVGCGHYIRTIRGVGYMLKADEAHV